MKKFLIAEKGRFYKANLHSHSIYSDGNLTPEQMKKAYMERGYSIIAFTDHNIFIPHNELSDSEFLALNGLEIDFYEGWNPDYVDTGKTFVSWKGCHLNFIALSPDNEIQPCYNRKNNNIIGSGQKYIDLIKFDSSKPDFQKIYSPEGVSQAMLEARKNGFYVVYNHPVWSLENFVDISGYNGFNAMEIFNYGCYVEGLDEYNPKIYDDVLKTGKKVFCVAGDDNHNSVPLDAKNSDSFGSFTMIKAEKLDYQSIAQSLLEGNFYASQGPEIYELYYSDGRVYVSCSDAERICYTTGTRRSACAYAEKNKSLNFAVFDVSDEDVYFRITVEDKSRLRANTNAYFLEDLKIR